MIEIIERGDGRIGFRVRVHPATPIDKLLGWNPAGELRVSIAAPPVEGKANRRLVAFLAKRLSVRKRDIRIEAGEKQRIKTLSAPETTRSVLERIPEI
jgi:uncharacterized protein (TIGR00251 family)